MTYQLRRQFAEYKPLQYFYILILLFLVMFFLGISSKKKESGAELVGASFIPLFLAIVNIYAYWFENDDIERRNKNRRKVLSFLEQEF